MIKRSLSKLDETLYYDICDNGLPIYMLVNDKVNNFYITYNVKYGSCDTEFKLDSDEEFYKVHNGVAHFLEHVNFNVPGGKTAHDLFNKLGSSINAFTTFNFTSYEVFASNNFKKNLNLLLDYVQEPVFTKELVEKERGIILEEVKMGKNNPGHKLYYGMNNALYKKDKRRNYITGDIKDVEAITCDELNLVYENFYHPMNSFVVITGNFNPNDAVKIIKENQKNKKFIKYRNPIRKSINEPREVNKEYKTIEANVELPKLKICYKMPLSIFGNTDKIIVGMYLGLLMTNNFGSTSLLRDELLEKNLVTGISGSREIYEDQVTLTINAETNDPDKVIKIIEDKMKNLELSEEELKRKVKASIAILINDFDDIEYVNSDIVDRVIVDGDYIDNVYDLYKSLNIKEAKEILNKIDLSNYCKVLLVPFTE